MLENGPIELYKIHQKQYELNISTSDLNQVRRSLPIKTIRKNGIAYWKMG